MPSPPLDSHPLAHAFRTATRAAALAAIPLAGGGDRDAVDGAAVHAMRAALADVPVDGRVVVGEGEKDSGVVRPWRRRALSPGRARRG
jgi:fructose-1,6-bisphosphatase/sedoheptulose 1,7-bisphosphatase-like protein